MMIAVVDCGSRRIAFGVVDFIHMFNGDHRRFIGRIGRVLFGDGIEAIVAAIGVRRVVSVDWTHDDDVCAVKMPNID